MRNNHLAAKRDVENNEVPTFHDSGQFRPTSGMQGILGQQEYHPLFILESEEKTLEERKAQRSNLILKLEQPVSDLRTWVVDEVSQIQRRREEVLLELDQRRDEIVKHESEMRYNGFNFNPSETRWKISAAIRGRVGAVIVFLLIELIVFGATYYVLEEVMGTVELVVRVLINGVVFGSIDFVRRRRDYGWRTSFLLVFLFLYTAMLVGPIATHSLQDVGGEDLNSWSMTEGTPDAIRKGVSPSQFLIEYHQYLLFVLWMSLLVIYISFSKLKPKPPVVDDDAMHESKVWPLIHAGMSNDVRKLESIVNKLDARKLEVEWQGLENLEELYTKLEALDKEYEDLSSEQTRIRTKREILLSNVMAALKGYESHYMQQLDKTPKNLVLQPRWPEKKDIKAYFNIIQ